MCDAQATSDEHVPPQSFFPPELQGKALLTVPSCDEHNTGNSLDVEYVRNVLSIQYGGSDEAEVVADKAFRSWDKSDKLFARTFREAEIAHILGDDVPEETVLFAIDLKRVKAVVSSIAHGLFYLEKGQAWFGDFQVFCAFHSKNRLQGLEDGSEALGNLFSARTYEDRPALHPAVFRYMVDESNELIFAMYFYDKVWIFARRIGKVIASSEPPILVTL